MTHRTSFHAYNDNVIGIKITNYHDREIPDLSRFVNLQSLYIATDNREMFLENLENIWSLHDLVELHLVGFNLGILTGGISRLTKLRHLFIRSCNLTQFPQEVLLLENLQTLLLDNNPFSDLPNDINGLQNLVRLSLRKTGIRTIPTTLVDLHHLTTFALDGCDLDRNINNVIRIITGTHHQMSITLTYRRRYYSVTSRNITDITLGGTKRKYRKIRTLRKIKLLQKIKHSQKKIHD